MSYGILALSRRNGSWSHGEPISVLPVRAKGDVFTTKRICQLTVGFVMVTACFAEGTLRGVWESDGYGYVFEMGEGSFKAFEVTSTTCVLGFTAQRVNPVRPGVAASFRSKDDAFSVLNSDDGDHRLIHQEDSVADIPVHRVPRVPASCDHPAPNTPEGNYEVFTKTWEENYIAFERRGVDWAKAVAEHRRRINANTPPRELFSILRELIEPLHDMHSFLAAPSLGLSTPQYWRSGTDRIVKGGIDRFAQRGRRQLFLTMDQVNLGRPAKMVCRGGLQYGELGNDTRYLRIRSFGGYSRTDDGAALETCLDRIFGEGKMKSLVIDLRVGFGGSDELGIAIARRLTAEPYLAYLVQARSKTGSSPKQQVMVQPSRRPGFYGPMAVLTGPVTLSASESFVLALMGRKPRVIRIGENTQGVFCDVLSRHLPNGWTFGLPNAVFSTSDGRSFDVTGIPPDIAVPVFAESDVAAKRDPAIEAARKALVH